MWAKAERSQLAKNVLDVNECEFIIYDETLIDALKLVDMKHKEPQTKRQIRWYEPIDQQMYARLDSVQKQAVIMPIVCYDLPMNICEWQIKKRNRRPIKLLRDIKEISSYGALK